MDGWIDGCNTVAPTHPPPNLNEEGKSRKLKKEEMR
jgi:hypothetical protein